MCMLSVIFVIIWDLFNASLLSCIVVVDPISKRGPLTGLIPPTFLYPKRHMSPSFYCPVGADKMRGDC